MVSSDGRRRRQPEVRPIRTPSVGGNLIRVLVVDDHELVRSGLVRMLRDVAGIDVVGEVASGEDAIAFCRREQPDVVLMDVRMPGVGGIEATRRIARDCPDVRVIVVTAFEDDPLPTRLLKAGAAGFVTKEAGIGEMIEAIRCVAKGETWLSPAVARGLAMKAVRPDTESPFESLSQRELQICMLIVQGARATDISERLSLSPKTVNSYRYRIFEKLDINGDVELTLLAIRYGLVEIGGSPVSH